MSNPLHEANAHARQSLSLMMQKVRKPRRKKFLKRRIAVQIPCWLCNSTRKYAGASCPQCQGRGYREGHEQLLLCIGGPFNGKFMNETALKHTRKTAAKRGQNDYHQYNSSVRGHRMPDAAPACLWVHKSLIPKVTE